MSESFPRRNTTRWNANASECDILRVSNQTPGSQEVSMRRKPMQNTVI